MRNSTIPKQIMVRAARQIMYTLKQMSTTRAGSSMNQNRIVPILALLALAWAAPAQAQGTVMPDPRITFLTNSGAVASGYKLCTYEAGTSTLTSTYSTSALTSTNSNPIILNSAGRATSNGSTETGVFLRPGQSYKFV
jgi:hypothetical protein